MKRNMKEKESDIRILISEKSSLKDRLQKLEVNIISIKKNYSFLIILILKKWLIYWTRWENQLKYCAISRLDYCVVRGEDITEISDNITFLFTKYSSIQNRTEKKRTE